MKKQFQSKSVPRGTRTLWRYLSALILLFTLGIGQMWAETFTMADIFTGSNQSATVTSPVAATVTTTATASNAKDGKLGSDGNYFQVVLSSGTFTAASINGYINTNKTDKNWGFQFSTDGGTSWASEVTQANDGTKSAHDIAVGVTIPSGANGIRIIRRAGTSTYVYSISLTLAASCSAPAAPTISGTTSYTEGQTIELTASCASGANASTTYTWYEGADWATASAASPVQAAAVAGDGGNVFTKTAALADNGKIYWCEAANSTCVAHSAAGTEIAVAASAAAKHDITYTNTKGADNSANPTQYTEGVGVASFEPLTDVANFHFTGWSPASIVADATTDQTIAAQWVDAFDVTFSAGAGSGTVPASFQKWEGGKFNLPGQGSMTAPAGKAFDGWKANGTGAKLAANAEYTMGNDAVEFVAQWKAVPQTIYSLTVTNTSDVNLNNGGTQNDLSDDATIVGGGAYMQNDHASKAQQILGSTKLQFKAGTVTLAMTLNTALKEGDTIKATGLNSEGLSFGVTFDRAGNLDNQLASDASYFIVPEGFEGKTTLYAWRHSSSGTTCASIIIRRPAERPVASTVITLSDVMVNDASISAANLATLVADHSLALSDEFAAAPVIKFNEHTVITYDDELLPATKVTDKVYTVTATVNGDGKWQASQTINSVAYTVTAEKVSSAKVYYYDGATKLGEEIVGIGDSPADYADFQGKDFATFVAWYSNSDLAEEHKIANIAGLVVNEATNIYGKWAPAYATSINIEQWVLDYGTGNSALRAELLARHYKYATLNNLDSLNDDPSKANRNYAYLGQKVNKTDSEISFLLKNGSTVNVRFGNLGSTINAVIGTADPVALTSADYANATPAGDKVYSYTATADVVVKFQCTGTSTSVFKQIMIDEEIAAVTLPWRVTYNANGGTCATASAVWSGSALILPDVTPAVPADYTFAGWYDEETGGELKGVAGASYTPADNETLFAHFAPVEYAINYNEGDHGQTAIVVASAGWGTEYTAIANPFTPETGYIFAGWAVSGVDGVSTLAAGGSFTMPKNEVTLTALWEDVSKVAVIVETNVKYESLADAVAAATDGQTIQLLQNNNVTAQVEVAEKAITLDLAGYKIEYTGTSTLSSGVLLVHNGASLTIDDSSDPDAGSIVAGNKAYAAIAMTKAGDNAANPAVLVINGGIFTGYYYGITGNGSRPNTEITINGGTINATAANDNLGIYHPQDGTLTVNGGTITGYASAIEMRAGTLVITGGTLTATATEYSCNPNGSGTTTVGAAIAISQHTTKKDIAVTISGGTFEGVKAINESNPQVNDPAPQVTMAVTGGDFTGEVSTVDVHEFISGGTYDAPVANENCATGWVPAPVDPVTGKYTVEPKDGVCLVKITPTSQTKGTQTGLYPDGDELTINLSSGMNLGGSGKYIGVKATENFQEGDVLHLNMSTYRNNQNATAYVYADKDASVFLFDTEEKCDENKDYYITMPAAVNGHKELYIVRTDGNKWNGGPSVMEVTRAMKPMLTAITIDGRDGVIDEANKTVAVQIPYEADLAALAVVPTIVWNEAAATNSIVVNDGSAWIEGPNSYKLTDKDGDYTIYTITLTRDVQKHTVSYNTHGGSAVASELVEDGGYLAAAPADPTKEDYIFQYWSEDEDGAEVDVTTVQINADKEFHAVWAADGAIKLINKTSGAVNEDGYFITGVTATEANSEKAAAWGGTQGAISGTNQLGKIVQYNATTNQTKVKVKLYSTNNSAKEVYLHKILEGETTAVVETIAVASKTPVETEYYTFNSDVNRSFYLTTNSTDVKILQVKVIDDGDVTLKRAGEAGYELNLNKGRVLAYANTDINFEGLAFAASSNYGVISSSELQIKAPLSFTISSPVTLTLNNNSNKYQVSQSISGSGDEYAAGEQVLDLTTTGTWYIVPTTTSAVKLTSIAFALPKCEKPTVADLANVELCAGEPYTELTVSATKSDEGTLHYAWFKEAGETDEAVGTDAASFTPAANGEYYVIVTNTLAGHQDNATTSNTISVAHFASVAITTDPEDVYKHAGLGAELSVVAEGKNVTYEWFTCDDELGNNPVAIVPAETAADLNLTAIESGIKYYQVVVTDECGTSASAVAKVEGFDDIALQDVTGNMTWDFSKANDGTAAGSNLCNDEVLANVAGIVNNSDFESDNIKATANKFSSGKLQASMIKFHTTVDGMIKVVFSNTDNKQSDRYLTVNGRKTDKGSKTKTAVTYTGFVYAGDVVLGVVEGDGNVLNFTRVEFKAEDNYHRSVDPSYLGTLCWTNNAVLGGATLYEFAGKDGNNKLVFDEVAENRLEAGKPYIFMPENGNTEIKLYNTDAEAALTEDQAPVNNMYGTITGKTLVPGQDDNMYYFSASHIWAVKDFTVEINVPAYYCYVDYAAVLAAEPAPAPAPGRRRVTMGVQGEQVVTGMENINASEQPMKLIINGQMFILRGEKMYDAQGRLVK